jgi:hypothetical protein
MHIQMYAFICTFYIYTYMIRIHIYVHLFIHVYTCTGNETLWYHRRAMADLILQKGNDLLRTYASFTVGSFNQQPKTINQQPKTIPSTQSDFYIILKKENNINEYEEKNDYKNEDLNQQSVTESFQYIKEIFEIISTDKIDDKNIILTFMFWINQWLLNEGKFVQNCIDDKEAWNYKTHRQMSLRYYCYILSKINKTFSYIIAPDSDIKSNQPIEKIPIFENKKFDKNFIDIKSFFMWVRNALVRTCEQLLAEDSLSRNWNYIGGVDKI